MNETKITRPRLLIEDWLPAAAIGVECMRERGSASALTPNTYLHVWWARRPLVAARAAVLSSLLPADFPRDVFERLLGFGRPGAELVEIRRMMDAGVQVPGGFNAGRAFSRGMREDDLAFARTATEQLWGQDVCILDPMAGGGSIPLESARIGFRALANEYNPVACTVLEATVDYPFRYGAELAQRTRHWGRQWLSRIENRLDRFFPIRRDGLVHAYIFARTVPCPDTGFETPLVPDWHLLKPKNGIPIVAVPIVDKGAGTWTIKVQVVGPGADQARTAPAPSYGKGTGISLFSGRPIPSDYIKAQAQAGRMGSRLYAVAVKTPQGLKFEPPQDLDLRALAEAETELARQRERWEQSQILPTENRYHGDCDRSYAFGLTTWALLFTPRQLLGMGFLVEELRALRPEIVAIEGAGRAEAVEHLLAFGVDKFLNHNCNQTRFENTRGVVKGKMDRHDFSFKATFAELAPCGSGTGLAWAIENVLEAWQKLMELPRSEAAMPVHLTLGSSTHLPQRDDESVTAIVVDPPYDDNVQYVELADFFYVWLKRTQGHRRPEWFSTYLCEHDEEAVVNVSRFRNGEKKAKDAKERARSHYRRLMTETFRECRRILRDDGALTVMFTHKKQEAWEALFAALIEAGFTITATWPVKTESEHSLHQAKKNAAQSTVLLVARKRPAGAGIGYFDHVMVEEIRGRARACAERLQSQGLNRVDQLVGSFGPAIEVYSQYDEVRTDTGHPVGVSRAIDEASDAVSQWCIDQLAARGLDGVEPEGRFALLCWDVLGASEFRFNEAMLLGHAVGMDVDDLIGAGLVKKQGDKVWILSAQQRRRDKALEKAEEIETLFGRETKSKRARKADALKIHPNDPVFRTALDGCQALALRYLEAGGGSGGIGNARALANQQSWKADGPVARLMSALLEAAPPALRKEAGARSAAALFPEFRAWHVLLTALFGLPVPDWSTPVLTPLTLGLPTDAEPEDVDDELDEEIEDEENDEEE